MSTPPWWDDLLAASDVLAASDRDDLEAWRGEPETDDSSLLVEPDEDDVPPPIMRLGNLAQAFAKNASRMDPLERRQVLGVLERILVTGSEMDDTVVVTGFFEALLMAWDQGFDLQSVWSDLGPKSQAACLILNEGWGVESPPWMR
ncbi:hypothetical protein [Streptomyces huiliensis]|uniref:hypothetical protein n=1 Tax=Streptomyces huiliensis TaxID=2876027 RepID=UPI001CC10B68|nr:hypothetical protein [Streptomyces huiliensis]MBZ4318657.1 hypothetical protein [Streptomyces huiliensis]